PMVASADPGERIVFIGRDAFDLTLDPDEFSSADGIPREGFGIVHALTGPVFINGAEAGDVLAVTIEAFEPADVGWTKAGPFGFAGDQFGTDERFIVWRINEDYAVSDALPGVRIPNASFPGVVTTLPDDRLLADVLARETQLLELGGAVMNPDPDEAQPASLCGVEGTRPSECLRTIPPREHGGNMDIRYITTGTTVYLPCYVDGCGLAVGDFHYAQGDGEVAGTAIEMGGRMTVTTRVVDDPPDLSRGPHYEGPASVLRIPSERFYAVTGFPLKEKGSVPADLAYLDSPKIAGLSNLSADINLAARNALAAMIDYITSEYGYDRTQAYMIASIAVDMRIGQLVDVPNVGVTAVLPLDIFVGRD
ncbi:MAG: acetamidase/formamidase family protein, partial [Gammaproteobacteria bacterium]|nr:acetamidase/formamidase family protein [Gammaproteobacteria bacterium]